MVTSISGGLIGHVRHIYDMTLQYICSGHGVRQGINGYTNYAPAAYIISTAAVEAFINEVFLSDMPRLTMKESPLWNIPKDTLERMELGLKLIIIPELLFHNTFLKGTQPHQDMNLLIKIRNEFVHFKMKIASPKYLETLDHRRISLVSPDQGTGYYAWTAKLSSSEGIRWAHNTACNVVHELVKFESVYKSEAVPTMASNFAGNFSLIPDSYPINWLKSKCIDPNSTNP